MKYTFSNLFTETLKDDTVAIKSAVKYDIIELFEERYKQEYANLKDTNGTNQITSELEHALFERNILVDSNFDEIAFLQQEFDKMDNETLTITIMPTEQCDLRCVYCYEQHVDKELNAIQYDLIFDEIRNRVELGVNRVDISWFGGEPLLKADEIISFNQRVAEFAKEKSIFFSTGITTNGVLLNVDTFKKLLSSGVYSYHITLDGFLHDTQRIFPDGSGSFNIIYGNIMAMLETELDFHLVVRVNISDMDFDFTFYDLFDKFCGDKRLHILTRTVGNFGGKAANVPIYKGEDLITKVLKEHNGYLASRGHSLWDNTSYGLFKRVCYAARKNSFVVRANGRINKCTIMLEEDYNDVGFLNENLNSISIDEIKEAPWVANRLSKSCIKCKDLSRCFNSLCPLNKVAGSKREKCCSKQGII